MERTYLLPSKLSPFQEGLYKHLIDWKRDELGILDPGIDHKSKRPYDAILPEGSRSTAAPPHIYEPVRQELNRHCERNAFRFHDFFFHVASSQAANINLFLPILLSEAGADVLRAGNADFRSVARDHLDNGYCIEFWGGNFGGLGPLGDKGGAGTDADLAIAYYDAEGKLCLWLIEHKLTEPEFTTCGGATSPARGPQHDCSRTIAEILQDKDVCYYHSARRYAYWRLTERNADVFQGGDAPVGCPFRGGMNQLWRNQLMALAIENDAGEPYVRARFTVVHHPRNAALSGSISDFQRLTRNDPRFSAISSTIFVDAAENSGDPGLRRWAAWYRRVYDV